MKIAGVWYTFDPSLKSHEVKTRLASFNSVLGYKKFGGCGSGVTDLDCGLFGAAGGTLNGNKLSDINYTRLGDKLDVYAGNLVSHIRTNIPTASMVDVVGGLSIIREEVKGHQGPHPDLAPDAPPPTIGTSSIAPEYRTRLRLNNGASCVSSGPLFYADEIDAQRLTIAMTNSGEAKLRLDGVEKTTWTVSPGGMTLHACVDHPYANNNGDQNNIKMSLDTGSGNKFAIINGWGDIGGARLAYHRKRLQEYVTADELSPTSEKVAGETLQINAVNWLVQKTRARIISEGLFENWQMNLHSIGVAGQVAGTNEGPYVDIPGSRSAYWPRKNATSKEDVTDSERLINLYASTGPGSAFESTTIEQATGAVGASTVTGFATHNGSAGAGMFYVFDTVTQFQNQRGELTGYSPGQLDQIEAQLAPADGQTYRVFLPKNGSIEIGDWTGYTYLRRGKPDDEGGLVSLLYAIDLGLNGGRSTKDTSPGQAAEIATKTADDTRSAGNIWTKVGNLISDPVNTFTGDYVYDTTDITVGSRSFPHGLGLQRSYNSGSRLLDGPFGYGWTHNLNIRASAYSDSLQGMGADSPVDAAAMIVTLYLGKQLYSEDPTLKEVIVATLLQDWGTRHLFDNVVTVTIPGASETFVKLPGDLGFNPPNRSNAKLTEPSEGEFRYETLDGTTLSFGDEGRLSTWQNANGFDVSFAYDAEDRLDLVSNEFGWTLEFQYDAADRIESVSDTLGRSVSYDYQADGDLKFFTDAEGNITEYFYDMRGRMTRIRYPSFPNVDFVKNTYDSLGRVKKQTNPSTGEDNPYRYFIAGTRSEEVDPYGNSRKWYQDDRGNVVKTIDQLGRETTSEYDGLDRLVKRTLPEGNSRSFTYEDDTCTTRCTNNVETIVTAPDAARGGPVLTESFTYWGSGKKG